MTIKMWGYLIFVIILGIVFAGIIIHTYGRGRKEKVERPKYRMLEEDDEQ